MKYKHHLFVATLATLSLVSSCQKDPDVFDQSPSARVEQYLERAQQTLLSSPEGWEARLYPSETQKWGGYTVLIKFTDRENCEVSNDLLGPDVVTKGQYRLDNSNNPSLIFTTYSRAIHLFSEPSPEGFFPSSSDAEHTALGADGDYSFQIQSVKPEEIVLVGARSRSRVVLTPVGKTSWKDQLAAIIQTSKDVDIPKFKLTGLGDDIEGRMNAGRRQLALVIDGEHVTVPFRYIDRGIEFYQPLQRAGKSVSRLLISGATADYTLASEDGSVKLQGQEMSLIEHLYAKSWTMDSAHSGQRTRQGFAYAMAAISGWRSPLGVASSATLSLSEGQGVAYVPIIARRTGAVILPLPFELTVKSSGSDEVSFSYQVPSGLRPGSTEDILYNQLALYTSLAGLCNLQVTVQLEDGGAQTLYSDPVEPRSYTLSADNKIRPHWILLTDKTDPTNKIYLFTDPTGVPTE